MLGPGFWQWTRPGHRSFYEEVKYRDQDRFCDQFSISPIQKNDRWPGLQWTIDLLKRQHLWICIKIPYVVCLNKQRLAMTIHLAASWLCTAPDTWIHRFDPLYSVFFDCEIAYVTLSLLPSTHSSSLDPGVGILKHWASNSWFFAIGDFIYCATFNIRCTYGQCLVFPLYMTCTIIFSLVFFV